MKLQKLTRFVWIFALGVLSIAGQLSAQENGASKLSPDLQEVGPDAVVPVIIQYADEMELERSMQGRSYGLRNLSGARHFRNMGISAGRMSGRDLQALASEPSIAYVTPDREVQGSITMAKATVNANTVHNWGYSGWDIGVAVLDSGSAIAESFRDDDCKDSRMRGIDMIAIVNKTTPSPADTYGHGTHVAGIIGGSGVCSSSDRALNGLMPASNLLSIKVLDGTGAGRDSVVIAALNWLITNGRSRGIRIINLSLGRPVFESFTKDPLALAVGRAWDAGFVVVVAAGNEGRNNKLKTAGYGTISSPGNHPKVITVGAINNKGTATFGDDIAASFSSKGPTLFDRVVKPDLVAPGNQIISVTTTGMNLYRNFVANRINTKFMKLSGTSMAAPLVAGAAGLILEGEPWLRPDDVKLRLMTTARKLRVITPTVTAPGTNPVLHDLFTVGAGLLDVTAAVESKVTVPAGRTAASPTVTFDAVNKVVRLVTGTNIVWGDTVNFPTSIVWGDAVVLAGRVQTQGSNVVWCDSLSKGFNIVWGDSVVWGDRTPFSEAVSLNGDPADK